jgi:hypothetical protein
MIAVPIIIVLFILYRYYYRFNSIRFDMYWLLSLFGIEVMNAKATYSSKRGVLIYMKYASPYLKKRLVKRGVTEDKGVVELRWG